MEKDFDYYLLALKNSYIKKYMISGTDFFISLTDIEEEAYQFFDEEEAENVNSWYCKGQCEVLYFEAEEPDSYYLDEDEEDND